MARDNIRNFCIIAHIDHGKSTLSDRILELTDSVDKRTMEDQILDDMELERERGITIKARAVTMHYHADDGKEYEFNLIDTPGHVDFQYEVSRSRAACEGAILVVDASQGVEAQTLANCYLAIDHNLEVVPILNKIDLPSADPDAAAKEVEDVIGLPCMDAPRVSAKMGINIREVLERVVQDVPAPQGDPDAPLKALIFDSIYDSYKGVIVYVRVFEGTVRPGDTIKLMNTGATFQLVEVGHMGATALAPCDKLEAGEVGYLTASIKTVRDTRVGDTITLAEAPTAEALPGFRQVTPMVFCGIYPADGADYPDLKDALEKLQLNDAALSFEPETSAALGFGFRCGFLGLLHLEIITERLEREFDLDLITTTPGVQYRLTLTDGAQIEGARLFIAAGVLETTRILLASQPIRGKVTLKDSHHAFLPTLHRWSSPRRPDHAPYHTLPQAFVELDDPAISPYLVHSQLYTWNEFFERDLIASYGKKLPGSAPLWRALARRLIVAQIFLHSDHSAKVELHLEPNGHLATKVIENPETDAVLRRAGTAIGRGLRAAGLHPLAFALRSNPVGSSFHAGSTVPMAKDPDEAQADILGRPRGLSRVHIVDASVLPSIPATTITLSVMANAHRIGTLAP